MASCYKAFIPWYKYYLFSNNFHAYFQAQFVPRVCLLVMMINVYLKLRSVTIEGIVPMGQMKQLHCVVSIQFFNKNFLLLQVFQFLEPFVLMVQN